jgi:hypothetical protein
MTTNNRLPALPSVSRIRPMFSCSCGCGSLTQRSFTPGHDARLKGIIIRVVRGVMTLDDVREWAEGRGEQTVAAVTKAMANKGLMARWNITIPKAEVKQTA